MPCRLCLRTIRDVITGLLIQSGSAPESGQRALALSPRDVVAGIGRQRAEAIQSPGGPDHLERLDPGGVCQAEVQPRVGGRLVASAAKTPGDVASATRDDGHPGADCVAIGGSAFQAKGQRVARGRPVVEIDQRTVLCDEQKVDPAVVVKVPRRKATGHPQRLAREPPRGRSRRSVSLLSEPTRSWAGMAYGISGLKSST